MDDDGNLLPRGETGEIVIRGANVTRRLREQPEGQRRGVHQRLVPHRRPGRAWTPTAIVSITGRLKEIINRGGEKISPREVDEVLMDHPAVAQVRHLRHAARQARRGGRGRRRAARGRQARPSRSCASSPPTRLADFKVPRKIVFLAEIPKGATGKLQRIGLAQRLGLTA